ncbi:uncharacterized protein LOC131249482 [Magnolia sinica]|uniref:uncharacterized protein LOC131249482 n=1 Tax=Magnolia sinica TaxID=86752 RepID=UPI002657F937|nr:uncharacterized protein LOC131249482 [Magnolia sinica]XP_058106285.1 uncharacterized protein LOC131249482 [Magnolia sinica]
MPPILWKKAKIGRISSLLSDLRSRRRESSLVVQTGFPTSLADLIVKNRSRLKKPSTKNVSADPPSSPVSSFSHSTIVDSKPCDDGLRSEVGEDSPRSSISRDADDLKNGRGVSGSTCFTAIIKVFVVVALALGTKELAVAITASVSILFFLEFVGKQWFFFSKPKSFVGLSDSNGGPLVCGSTNEIRRIGCALDSCEGQRRLESPQLDCKREPSRMNGSEDLIAVKNTANPDVRCTNEIQAIESNLDLRGGLTQVEKARIQKTVSMDAGGLTKVQTIRIQKAASTGAAGFTQVVNVRTQKANSKNLDLDLGLWGSKRRLGFPVLDQKREVSAYVDDGGLTQVESVRIQKVGSKNFKEKFLKKFVPKRFRSRSRKCGKVESGEMSNCKGEVESEEDYDLEDEEICSLESSNDILEDDLEDEDVAANNPLQIHKSEELATEKMVVPYKENVCTMIKWNAGHMVSLVIILLGLTGGRAVALILTILWHLLVKLVETLWRKLKMYCSRPPLL